MSEIGRFGLATPAADRDHPLIKTFLAQVWFYRGEHVKAAEMVEQVLEQQPQLDGIRPIYATFLSALGFSDEAREQCRRSSKCCERPAIKTVSAPLASSGASASRRLNR